MSKETSQRDERAAQLVDEPAEQADRLDQGSAEEQVTDRDYDGSADSVSADSVTTDSVTTDDTAADAQVQTAESGAAATDVDGAVDGAVPSEVADDDVEDAGLASDDGGAETAGERDELMPGEMSVAPVAALWSSEAAGGLQDRWQQLQLRFVDDPRGVVVEAQSLVAEEVQGLTSALTDQQADLDGWASGGIGDTEQLRVVLQRYRDFFDRLLAHA